MLSEMFNLNDDFIDTKDEDFLFKKNNFHYMFEFKGLTKDIKKSNISQLMTHVYKFSESNNIDLENIKRIIIVTRFKDSNPETRTKISKETVSIAKNSLYNVLIIDSYQFLKLFEQFKIGKISSEDCLEKFNGTGELIVDSL
ncbi:hypothetical protein JHK62_06810 [Streptococcus sp. CSL7591-lung]|uniref:Restriction endonuclease type IV Mrr domain-containing protein n=2 Tax=Streptococcus pacificus TaxID=2740577 RepID=A0ABS0ZK80_9STRE|nr:hypothetical protein [Streptococcus pacificus]